MLIVKEIISHFGNEINYYSLVIISFNIRVIHIMQKNRKQVNLEHRLINLGDIF